MRRSLASSPRRFVSQGALLAIAMSLAAPALAGGPPQADSAKATQAGRQPGAGGSPADRPGAASALPEPSGAEQDGNSASAESKASARPSQRLRREAHRVRQSEVCPLCVAPLQLPDARRAVQWHGHWRSVGLPESIAAPVLLASGVASYLAIGTPSEARWSGTILLDTPARNLLRFNKSSHRRTAETISDALFFAAVLHPVVVDPLLSAWWAHESPQVAWQMSVINAQAYGLTMLLNGLTKRLTARARPWAKDAQCDRDPSGEGCDSGGAYRSFYSGHSAMTATGAGLACAHHTQLPLYQDPLLDIGACVVAVAGAAVTGAMRIASDNHWASDVLIGDVMGFVSGYLLPTLIYYKQFTLAPGNQEDSSGPMLVPMPLVMRDALGVSLFGAF